jgi:SAM-dependent methyltransferase
MALRFFETGLLENASYTLVEQEADYLEEARETLAAAGDQNAYQVKQGKDGLIEFSKGGAKVRFAFQVADALQFSAGADRQGAADLIIAHALLDLLDLKSAVPQLLSALRPGGLFYFPINYDGLSSFEPLVDAEFEAQVLAAYHRTMDERLVNGQPSGDSQTGRHLFGALKAAGVEVLAAGSSDWLVFPQGGGYVEDEGYFLLHILQMIEGSVSGKAELDAGKLSQWLSERRVQVERGELVFMAHQLDFFGRKA